MAIYFNLGIDCGRFSQTADIIERHFKDLKFRLPGIADVECEVSREQNLDYQFVCVWPRGMGYGTRDHRPELLQFESLVKSKLYEHLSHIGGYRRALFGGEAFDVLWGGTAEELMDNDYINMIYANEEFPTPTGGQVMAFAEGYSIVLDSKSTPN